MTTRITTTYGLDAYDADPKHLKQVIPHASRERLAQVIGCAVEELTPKCLDVPVSGRGNR